MKTRIKVSVVAYQEGDNWIAQGIEFDIRARAKNLADLPVAFERAVMANVCMNADLGRATLEGIEPAPERFRDLFKRGSVKVSPIHKSTDKRFPVAPNMRLVAA